MKTHTKARVAKPPEASYGLCGGSMVENLNTDIQHKGPYDWIAEDNEPSLYVYQQQTPVTIRVAKIRYQGQYEKHGQYLVASSCHQSNRPRIRRLMQLPPYSDPVSQRHLGRDDRIQEQHDEMLFRKENHQPYTRSDLLLMNHKSESLGVATFLSDSFRDDASFQNQFDELKTAQARLEESDTSLA